MYAINPKIIYKLLDKPNIAFFIWCITSFGTELFIYIYICVTTDETKMTRRRRNPLPESLSSSIVVLDTVLPTYFLSPSLSSVMARLLKVLPPVSCGASSLSYWSVSRAPEPVNTDDGVCRAGSLELVNSVIKLRVLKESIAIFFRKVLVTTLSRLRTCMVIYTEQLKSEVFI